MDHQLLAELEAARARYDEQRVPGNVIERHLSFDNLLAAALRAHL
jgi:hypothetical protein